MRRIFSFSRPQPPPTRPELTDACRAAVRLGCFLMILLAAAVEWTFLYPFADKSRWNATQAAWLQRVCRRIARLLSLKVSVEGPAVVAGLLVCNHLSYLDVIVLAARQPLLFVAKREVRNWPLIGWLAACGGTIFVDREQRSDVARGAAELSRAMAGGAAVCVFPEGTSSDGTDVLPFHSPLFQPAITGGWRVQPVWIGYQLEHGSVADEVCYWRDMAFLGHFLNLLRKDRIAASVRFGKPLPSQADRKSLARQLRGEVRALGRLPAECSNSRAA